MELKDQIRSLHNEIAVLLAEKKELQERIDSIDKKLTPKLLKKRRLEEQLIEVQHIPTGHSGRKRKAKTLDVDKMSGAAAEALLAQLLAAVGKKGG